MPIKNLIFDLGGVLLNLDFGKTSRAFAELGIKDFDDYFSKYKANPLFKGLETGSGVNPGFHDSLRKIAAIDASNEAIDKAWNAMLLDFPADRIRKLQELSKNYRLFLFSNTNAIHHATFHQKFRELFGFDFDSLFEKAYYSHLIGYRKPDDEAFQYVISDSNVIPAETLFIDDTFPNIESAKRAGLNTGYVTPEKDMLQILDEMLKS